MKKFALVVALLLSILIVSLIVQSQLGDLSSTEVKSTTTYISPEIELIEKESCTTTFFDETMPVYGTCTFYLNHTSCLNSTGPNTDCSSSQSTSSFQCQTGVQTLNKNSTSCTPNNEFLIEIDDGLTTLKKKIDYSDWGPCIKETQGNCLIVTCVSYNDGAHNGQFTDCNGGKSCQRFEICEEGITTTYKNSREQFAEDDQTFYYNHLQIQEVGP